MELSTKESTCQQASKKSTITKSFEEKQHETSSLFDSVIIGVV